MKKTCPVTCSSDQRVPNVTVSSTSSSSQQSSKSSKPHWQRSLCQLCFMRIPKEGKLCSYCVKKEQRKKAKKAAAEVCSMLGKKDKLSRSKVYATAGSGGVGVGVPSGVGGTMSGRTDTGEAVAMEIDEPTAASGHQQFNDKQAEQSGDFFMFVGRVLVGRTCRGKDSMRRPEKDSMGRMTHTAVDSLQNPNIFVVFDNTQCYPEYLVQYTTDRDFRNVAKPPQPPFR